MNIHLFKPAYHELFKLLTKSSKLINQTFKIGTPEGPPVLEEVYQLQMDLRISTNTNPDTTKIKQVLNSVLDYFSSTKVTPEITNLKNSITQYLTTV